MPRALALLLIPFMSSAANYSASSLMVDGLRVIRLHDETANVEVLISPDMGNNAYSMKVSGKQVMWQAAPSLAAWKAKPTLAGNPLLWPFANRIDQASYYANGKKYVLNTELGNVRKDGAGQPIHGFFQYTDAWEVTEVRANGEEAVTTSRIEFWKRPDWMAQFPFAHTIEMRHRLRGGALEVETVIRNLSNEPMPIAVGYHPYFQLPGVPRDDWKVHIAARDHVALTQTLVPSGETKPNPYADPHPLAGSQLDDVFTGLVRRSDGRAAFSVEASGRKLEVIYGPKYPVAVIYAPKGREFICFEPMAGVTNAFNLGHAGKFPLQSAAPGTEWRESFWIRTSGF